MRTKVTLLFILAIFTAQITAGQNVQTEVISFQINPVKANISDLIEYERRNPVKVEVPDLSKKIPKTGYPNELPLPEGAKIIPFIGGSNTNSPDPIVPTPDVPSPSPSLTFESLIDNISSIPPDVQGVVGPNHVFTVLNSQYRYHNRTTGATLSTVTPTTFWSPTGKTGIFDPNMVYDPFNNRWIFAICARTNPESFLLVAVSQTNDQLVFGIIIRLMWMLIMSIGLIIQVWVSTKTGLWLVAICLVMLLMLFLVLKSMLLTKLRCMLAAQLIAQTLLCFHQQPSVVHIHLLILMIIL